MDLTQFETLEQKVLELIERQNHLRVENQELRAQSKKSEEQLRSAREENKKLTLQSEELLKNQRDSEKEAQIRSKVADLLHKLEGL